MSNFSIDIARSIVENKSDEQYPVDFDDLVAWCDYSRKADAKNKLLNNFDADIDYKICGESSKTPNGGRPRQIIKLTLDAAKQFAMLSQTKQGKLVRKYFIEVEKEYRKSFENLTPIQITLQNAINLAEMEKRQIAQEKETNLLKERVLDIERNRLEAAAKLEHIELSDDKPEELTVRKRLNMLVRNYVQRNDVYYNEVWGNLYKQLYYRYSFDVKSRARKFKKEGIKKTLLDIVEENDMLNNLFAIASEILA